MSSSALKKLAQEWILHFNNKDLENLLNLYHDDAIHFSPKLRALRPETNGLVLGKEALRLWWEGAFLRLPTLFYELNALTCEEDRIFIQYTRKVTGEQDLDVAEYLEVKDGKIASSRVYHG